MTTQTISTDEIARIVNFEESNPHSILGPKKTRLGGKHLISVRAFLPRAKSAWLTAKEDTKVQMERLSPEGFFEGQLQGDGAYQLGFEDETGFRESRADPYSFPAFIPDDQLRLLAEGRQFAAYEIMGAHLMELGGVHGVGFAVWAPNARSVAVVGNFNHWRVGEHPMRSRGSSGVWELFVPGLEEGEVYKFAIRNRESSEVKEKADPYAFGMELRPRTGARVVNLEHRWGDSGWMDARRRDGQLDGAVSVYEVHLGSWRRRPDGSPMSYDELVGELVPYLREMGFTHLELMPIMEHPLDDSWGYQVVNYFAPTTRYGEPQALMRLIDACHQNGIGVILDWVPAHFPKDDYGLGMFDGTHLYEHADPRLGEHPDWGTYIFNYGRNEVKSFLVSSALFWLEKYHADGLRMDAVASMLYLDYSRKQGEWLPNAYGGRENLEAIALLRTVNDEAHSRQPGVLVAAEESTAWPGVTAGTGYGGLGFDLKWNMGWMHDTLQYFSKDPLYRKYHQNQLTFSLWYAFSERFILVLSHDEVVYGKGSMLNKMPGDRWQKFANLRLCYGYMFTHPGKKLLFMGNEMAQEAEWDFKRSLDWPGEDGLRTGLKRFVGDLNSLYRGERSLHSVDFKQEGFEWIDFKDYENSIISFMRRSGDGDELVIVCNMTPVPRTGYRIGVPRAGRYTEILNSDAKEYGGSGMGNLGGADAENVQMHGRENSISLTLPPLSVLVLRAPGK